MKKSIIFLNLVMVLLLIPQMALACRGGESDSKEPLSLAYKNSSTVFIGKVLKVSSSSSSSSPDLIATFKIVRSFKGQKEGTLTFPVETGRSCDLGKYLEADSRWFVIAKNAGDKILTASHSRRLFDSKEESEQVAALEKNIKATN